MTKYTEIIDKYLDGEMTPQEALTFEQQIKTDPDLAYEVKLHQIAIAGVQHSEEVRFQEFKSRMKAIESDEKDETPVVQLKPKRSGAVRWAMRIAAVLMPLLLLYFLFPTSENYLDKTRHQLSAHYTSGTKGIDDTNTPQEIALSKAIQQLDAGNQQAAIISLNQIKAPNLYGAALFFKAVALDELGKKDEAREALERICPEGNDNTLCEKTQNILKNYK